MFARRVILPLLTLGLLLAAGCGGAKREDPIHARNDAEFETWIADHDSIFSADEIKELDDAKQQIKFLAMTERHSAESDAFNNAVYGRIDQHTAREVLVTGYLLRVDREQVELQNYDPELQKLQRYVADRHLDADQHRIFADDLERIQKKIAGRHATLAQLQKRLEELKAQSDATKP